MRNIDWGRLKSPDFSEHKGAIVILPIGSMEQHGPHLPVQVDSMLATEVARQAASLLGGRERVLVLPALWISLAEHHMGFPGSLTLDFDTFRAVLRCIVGSLSRQGFEKVLLLNGHGGNISALPIIVDELARSFQVSIVATTYWNAAAPRFAEILDQQPNVRHACEAETSMVLAIEQELVNMHAAKTLTAPADGLVDTTGIVQSRSMAYWSESGVVGVPRLASSEKGRLLVRAAAEVLAARLTDESTWSRDAKAAH